MIVHFSLSRMVCSLSHEEEKGRGPITVSENLNHTNLDLSKSKSKDVA